MKIYFNNLNGIRFLLAFMVIILHTAAIKQHNGLPNYLSDAPYLYVAGEIAVEGDRCVQAVPHVGQIALECGPGDAEAFLQFLAGHEMAGAKDLVDLVDAFHAAHYAMPSPAS